MLFRLILIMSFFLCCTNAVLSGKELDRRKDEVEKYSRPPGPALLFYSPPKHEPHREYGVPQKISFKKYGPPSLKYGPPMLGFIGGGEGSTSSNSLNEQIKTHFGVPRPFYGPPHTQYKQAQYGPPPLKTLYVSPATQYGLPQQSGLQNGPSPLNLSQRPPHQFRAPPPLVQQSLLPAMHPAELFKPDHRPATSYGPPASGPLRLSSKVHHDIPTNYGPPPLPVTLPERQQLNYNLLPQPIILLSDHQLPNVSSDGPLKQMEVQIDAFGHTHGVSGSHTPFHTACDGWKPITAPVGTYIERNQIESHGGYSHVGSSHSQSIGTLYNVGVIPGETSILDGLTDDQLVAVSLQGEGNAPGSIMPQNSINSERLQLSLSSIEDTYSKPSADSFVPGDGNAYNYKAFSSTPAETLSQPSTAQSSSLKYEPARLAGLTSSKALSMNYAQTHFNENIYYGVTAGNSEHYFQKAEGNPKEPVTYRPSVPIGLLESIGATVQHLDQFGVKPLQQASTYIPPAAQEIALSGPPNGPQAIYGQPLQTAPQVILYQQLPQTQLGQTFAYHKDRHVKENNHQSLSSMGPHYVPPQPQSPMRQLSLTQQAPRLNQRQATAYDSRPYIQQLQQHSPHSHLVYDCGYGPNFISGTSYQVNHQQQQIESLSSAAPGALSYIAQSIPVAEQHTQFFASGADSNGPPLSGNDINLDHSGFASQKSAVAFLPEASDPQQLLGLHGLNVSSAQKSQSIRLDKVDSQPTHNFQVQFNNFLHGAGSVNSNADIHENSGELVGNHEEILSQGLLQSILTAIEQPQITSSLSQNHKAQSRFDEQQYKEKKKRQEDQDRQKQQVTVDKEQREKQKRGASDRIELRMLTDLKDNTEKLS